MNENADMPDEQMDRECEKRVVMDYLSLKGAASAEEAGATTFLELKPAAVHHGALLIAKSNMMLAAEIRRLRWDLQEAFEGTQKAVGGVQQALYAQC